jgi:hypothetical protein
MTAARLPSAPRVRTGVLVLRVWTEGGGGTDFRGRIIASLDVADQQRELVVVRAADEAEAFISEWLRRFVAHAAPGAEG